MIPEINTDAWLDYDLNEHLSDYERELYEYICEHCGKDFDVCELNENDSEICPHCKKLI